MSYKSEIEAVKKEMERDERLDDLIYKYSLSYDQNTGRVKVHVPSNSAAAVEQARKEITENKAAIIERLKSTRQRENTAEINRRQARRG